MFFTVERRVCEVSDNDLKREWREIEYVDPKKLPTNYKIHPCSKGFESGHFVGHSIINCWYIGLSLYIMRYRALLLLCTIYGYTVNRYSIRLLYNLIPQLSSPSI